MAAYAFLAHIQQTVNREKSTPPLAKKLVFRPKYTHISSREAGWTLSYAYPGQIRKEAATVFLSGSSSLSFFALFSVRLTKPFPDSKTALPTDWSQLSEQARLAS